MTPEDEIRLLRQHVGIVHVVSSSGNTETRCMAHLLPRHHQMLLDECERLRNELRAAQELARKQAADYEAALATYRG